MTSSAVPAPQLQTPVVGLGASAGGLRALQTFLDHTPPDTGMAFVVILHLAPDYESQAASLLQAHTGMPVVQVTSALPVLPNRVYVIPPAQQLLLVDTHLRLAEPASTHERHMPIDHFFRTLADTQGRYAAAVILSGTGSDGALGLKRIKEQGGTILVQEPQEAEFDGLPRSAIATGLVDSVLPVAEIPAALSTYWTRATDLALPVDRPGNADAEAALREILAVLRVRTAHDFSQYKRPTLLRRLGRRLQITGAVALPDYLALLRSRPEEVQALLQDLLISVTNFFRDPPVWAALAAALPQLFAGKGSTDQVRVWVPACATGEEAYTVAMLLQEYAQTLDEPPTIQVFATDIDDQAIAQARAGRYSEAISSDVSPARLRQFFVLDQGLYRVTQSLRDVVLFAHHNVLRDPPFSKLDLITCRNLLIYLNRPAQTHALRLFHFSLRPGGFLLLGSAEALDGQPDLFTTVAKAERLFQQRMGPTLVPPALPAPGSAPLPVPQRTGAPAPAGPRDALTEQHQRLLQPYLPPSVIVTGEHELLHLSPGVERYLQYAAGAPSANLLRAAHPDLRHDLRSVLMEATQRGQRSERQHVAVTFGNAVHDVQLIAEPIPGSAMTGGALLVVFIDNGPLREARRGPDPNPDAHVQALTAELERTRAQLQATTEEYEAAGEEQRAANEELQAINEELRVASEELESSKEELQAVNEELLTINQELKHKVDEVSQSNNDLQNLIAAAQNGTLFLDRSLRLTRYTPSVEAIFNLIPSDLGRPLSHVTHDLQDADLVADATKVLTTLVPLERELRSTTGHWYLVQLRPYRTTDDRIGGVVVTFVDITARKQAASALAEQARLLDLSNDAIIVRDVDHRIIYWNHGATELYGWTQAEALGKEVQTLLQTTGEPGRDELAKRLLSDDRLEGEVTQVTRHGRQITAYSRWALDRDSVGRPGAMLTTFNDITDRKAAEAAREELLFATDAARQAAERAVQAREQFLSIASHELRTPLTALLGFIDLLKKRLADIGDPDGRTARTVGTIDRQAHRLVRLVEHLLDVTRLQHGQLHLERNPMEVGALVAEAVAAFQMTLPEDTRHTITLTPAQGPVPVVGDAARFDEVITNLLSNAVKYSPDGGAVDVRITDTPDAVAIAVTDHGMGIPADAQAHLFEPFYRAGNVSASQSGFGIGLYVVNEIVRGHGGRIEVDSTEGVGSTFRVILPRPTPGQ